MGVEAGVGKITLNRIGAYVIVTSSIMIIGYHSWNLSYREGKIVIPLYVLLIVN